MIWVLIALKTDFEFVFMTFYCLFFGICFGRFIGRRFYG